MADYEFWISMVFGISFVINFLVGITAIGRLTRGPRPAARDYNSPRFIGGLLLGFFGGVMANVFLTLFFEGPAPGNIPAYGWMAWAVVVLAGGIIITILYFMVKVELDRKALGD